MKCPRCKRENDIGSVLDEYPLYRRVKCWYCALIFIFEKHPERREREARGVY